MDEEEEVVASCAGGRVYVGNLTPKANETHLQQLFARFGVILNIWVARKVRLPCGHFEGRHASNPLPCSCWCCCACSRQASRS